MHTVLDLDLDAFTSPTVYMPQSLRRPSNKQHLHAGVDDVRYFLEQQCGLRVDQKIVGVEFVEHDEAFFTWRRWIDNGVLTAPFAVVHVDAHADLGIGDAGFVYLMTELLGLPVSKRRDPCRGQHRLNSGNYLPFAIANHWLASLTYVYPARHPWAANWNSSRSCGVEPDRARDGVPGDLMSIYFRNDDYRTGSIELRHCSKWTLNQYIGRSGLTPVIHTEPPVPFDFQLIPEFRAAGFTHLVVAQSPKYVPSKADQLLRTIREYFTPNAERNS